MIAVLIFFNTGHSRRIWGEHRLASFLVELKSPALVYVFLRATLKPAFAKLDAPE